MVKIIAIVTSSYKELNDNLKQILENYSSSTDIEYFDFQQTDSQLSEQQLAGLIGSACSASFFSTSRVAVLRNAQDLKVADIDTLFKGLEKSFDENIVILSFLAAKLSTSWQKVIKANKEIEVISSSNKKVADLMNESNINFTPDAKKYLIENFDKIDELKTLLDIVELTFDAKTKVSFEDILPYISNGSKSIPPYLITNLLDQKNALGSIKMFYDLVNVSNMHPLQILSVISSRYKKIAQIKSANVRSVQDVIKVFDGKIKEYPAKLLLQVANSTSSSAIKEIFYQLHLCDCRSKGLEGFNETDAMINLIYKLCTIK